MRFRLVLCSLLPSLIAAATSPDTKVQLAPALKKQAVIDNLTASLASAQGIRELDQLTKALKSLTSDFNTDKICSKIPKEANDLNALAYAIKIADNSGCENEFKLSDDQIASAKKTEDITELYHSVTVLKRSNELANHRTILAERLAQVIKPDNNLLEKSLGVLTLMELGSHKLSAFPQIVEKLDFKKSFLMNCAEFDNSRIVPAEGDIFTASVATTAVVMMSKATQTPLLSNNQVVKLANFFLLEKSEKASENALIASALHALNADLTTLGKPVQVNTVIEYPILSISMTDVFGEQVQSGRFTIEIESKIVDVESTGIVDLSTLDLIAGKYDYSISVSGADAYAGALPPKKGSVKIAATTGISVANENILVHHGEKYNPGRNVAAGQKVRVIWNVNMDQFPDDKSVNIKIAQAFVKYSQGDKVGYVIAVQTDFKYIADLELTDKSMSEVFHNSGGDWNVEIICGDARTKLGTRKQVGKIKVDIPAGNERESLASILANRFAPKKLITHLFKEPDARPPAFISLVFTGAVLAPFMILFICWGTIGVNFKNFQFAEWSTYVFHGSFGAILLLYVCYWLKLNMFETIRYLFPLGSVCALSGNFLLRKMAALKTTNDKKTN